MPAPSRPVPPRRALLRRPRALGRRLVLLGGLGIAAFGAGLVIGGGGDDPRAAIVREFARAWERGDHAGMHALLSGPAQARASARRLARTYDGAAAIATVRGVRTGAPRPVEDRDGVYRLPVTITTRAFGTVRSAVELPVEGEDERAGIDWSARHSFPGLRDGERLERRTELAPRAALLARDGSAVAEGPERASELDPLATEIAGRLGPIPPERAESYARLGIPEDALVGLTGLEREFDLPLIGRPGGTLTAGGRVLAREAPQPGEPVRTSIDPEVQRASVEALAGRFGGIAVMRPSTGEVVALAGIAFSAPQPPGSTFKIITLAGALEAGIVERDATFPVETATRIEGVELENANGESCGGSLSASFAESCNSVFAPLGAKLGARRLVAAAERFGFNEDPPFQAAQPSSIPPADQIGDDLAVGSTAIGQGRVLATPLQMASVAATIAEEGRRVIPSLRRGGAPEGGRPAVRATTPEIARTVTRFMRRVVSEGTGTAAAIPGVSVAGKTGTAELRDTTRADPATGGDVLPGETPAADPTDTDAWFTAFAPATRPRYAVAVLLVGQGAGGETAAPAAKLVLQAALK